MNGNNDNRKNILITGSSRGIGLAIAKKFSSQGHKIAINSRNKSDLLSLCQNDKNFVDVSGDVSSEVIANEVVKKAISKLGSLDILICNVGSGKSVFAGNETFQEWERIFAINFFSATNVIEASKQYLESSKGCIVCISSICGSEVIDGAPLTYSVAKAALNSYIKGISRPLGKKGIRINGVSPGNILFESSVWDKKLKEDKVSVDNYVERNVALNMLGDTDDISNIVIYLSSPLAKFVTGSIWSADGGQLRS